MITAILDTNVILQSLTGSPRASSARTLQTYRDGQYRLAFSPATIDELLEVLITPSTQAKLGWSDDELLEFIESLLVGAIIREGRWRISPSLARDITDTKFLALAEESDADYLVTNDRRHLLRLGRYQRTRIVRPTQFLKELA